ncbi:MAG: hypothetical protein JW889_09975 [Verrucomicrobia bacterium]|nr:hypothetical protein [Verrucomicrobiota bacterium]
MNAESRMLVCLVCHTEPDVWDGGFCSIDHILPQFMAMSETVRDGTGTTPRVAWCLTSRVARRRPEAFLHLLERGHEIGVHSHFPRCESGKQEHDQNLNRENLDDFQSWFPELCSHITDAGFPLPRTHATWMFAYRDSMTRVLAETGIRAECSVCYGGAHHLPGGYLLADSRKRVSGKPYRLAEDDHCAEGDSPVVELPVSGGFGSYWEPDETGGFKHFGPVLTNAGRDRQRAVFQARLDSLVSGEIDIFHIHFHLHEFLPPDGTGPERLKRARSLLDPMTHDERVRFMTPSEAVEEWSRNQEGDRQSHGGDADRSSR